MFQQEKYFSSVRRNTEKTKKLPKSKERKEEKIQREGGRGLGVRRGVGGRGGGVG